MTKTESYKERKTKVLKNHEQELVLHNDEVNSFDFVIESLIEVCKHDQTQAEQCALIAHFKGKCTVLNGAFSFLDPYRKEMLNRGLTVTID